MDIFDTWPPHSTPIFQDSLSLWDSISPRLREIFIPRTEKFLNPFRRQSAGNRLQFRITRAIFCPYGMILIHFWLRTRTIIRKAEAKLGPPTKVSYSDEPPARPVVDC